MQPGEYSIPVDISMTYAKCAVADGHGEIIEAATFRNPRATKTPAPENKSLQSAPETKSPLAGSDRRSDGAKPDAGSGKTVRGPRRSGGK